MIYTLGQISGDLKQLTNGEFLKSFLEEVTTQFGPQLMYCPCCEAIAKHDTVCPYCDEEEKLEFLSGSIELMAIRLDQGLLPPRRIKQAHYRSLYGPVPFYELEYVKG